MYGTPSGKTNLSFNPEIIGYNDYYPFGMLVPNRHGQADSYRYGFQGQEKDDEVKGEGNSINYKFRMHDPRVGRFLSIDPLASKYAHYSPYSFSGNKVISHIEREGLEEGWMYFDNNAAMSQIKLSNNKELWEKGARYLEANLRAFSLSLAFEASLPKKLVNHYTNGVGKTLVLNEQGMKDVNPSSVSIYAGSFSKYRRQEARRFLNELNSIKPGESKKVKFNVLSQSNTTVALGKFTVKFSGILKKDSKDPKKWEFDGDMEFYDLWDFDRKKDGVRTESSSVMTKVGRLYLIGEGFEVKSSKIKVKQSSTDNQVDYWDKNPFTREVDRVSKFLENHPKIKEKFYEYVKEMKEDDSKE
ncbi:RHS repeat-associated core domain-containing protein [Tenacibaculum maritimum]|uniref:RHS repeat domain-containing protein n=1 Tax=Tenacibaculum maritimum TaxID=107401 RepID=UPI00388D10C3